jgi:hypothetical protein
LAAFARQAKYADTPIDVVVARVLALVPGPAG